MTTIESIAARADSTPASVPFDQESALRFITCGSVDDGKSTLIGRLLVDSRAVLQDQLAGVQRGGAPDLALLTDGLAAEREQGITIDVAYRYFATERASSSSATRRATSSTHATWSPPPRAPTPPWCWSTPPSSTGVGPRQLLPQTRRHSLLAALLRVPSLVFAVNKLDAVPDPPPPSRASAPRCRPSRRTRAWPCAPSCRSRPCRAGTWWSRAPTGATTAAPACSPCWKTCRSPRRRWASPGLAGAVGGKAHVAGRDRAGPARVLGPRGRRHGGAGPGRAVLPSGQGATVVQVLDHVRQSGTGRAGASVGLVLDRELDISRGDWLLAPGAHQPTREIEATVAWLDDTPLTTGRVWALHGHRWVKARVTNIAHRLDVNTLAEEDASELPPNAIGHVTLALQEPWPCGPTPSRARWARWCWSTATHAPPPPCWCADFFPSRLS
jgi:sulfate adenylyltransferase subunit 1